VSYYGYQNWRSKRAWKNFQARVMQSGQPLNVSSLLPEAVSDDANFARTRLFLGLLSKTNREPKDLFERISSRGPPSSGAQGNTLLMEWSRQTAFPLNSFATRISPHSTRAGGPVLPAGGMPPGGAARYALANRFTQQPGEVSETNRAATAAAILRDLQPRSETMRELADAASHFNAFQTSSNRGAVAVLQPDGEATLLLERLHLLFQVRACASLVLGREADAADDVLTGLRLARLAQQVPDARSTVRVQVLLMRSLQPLWEGLNQHAWSEPQLSSFQQELAGFNLLADYTNAICRVVLAQIEIWRMIPDDPNRQIALPASGGGYMSEPAWQFQPRAWWFDNCIQLHKAGQDAIQQVAVASGRIQQNMNWSDLEGLPLDSPSQELLQQSWWWGANPASVAFAQTSVNQAILACGLERFRMQNRKYPTTLEELVPRLLDRVPHDAVSGRPMIYQRVSEIRFILRGVGPNGVDDRNNKASDDWLWTYPTNTASASK
jgi:hypothetical protein